MFHDLSHEMCKSARSMHREAGKQHILARGVLSSEPKHSEPHYPYLAGPALVVIKEDLTRRLRWRIFA
jgi:hypothetical protein